ncbi:MAG: hypothetical protein JW768_04570 [Chitinispirillaceae bacterium]|nr:hypothetical protein [Chitinispirillaceae bacterium]
MRSIGRLIVGLSVLALIASCGLGSYEQRGDSAYRKAQGLDGIEKRLQQKMAYTMYQRAIESHPNRINNRLRSRFLELSLARAKMVLNEGSANSDAIPLFMNDIEKHLTTDAPPNIRQEYALFLIQLSDSFSIREQTERALVTIDKAISFASDPNSLVQKKQDLIARVAKENFELAEFEFENGKQNKDDVDAMIRAEYFAKKALLYAPENEKAKQLLSELHKINAATYSGYLRVIENIIDSSAFRKINKYDILLAIPSLKQAGGVSATVSIYNYSYNPLRMKSEHFFIVDEAGKRYQAHKKALQDPEILDQEHEAKYTLSFPKPAGKVQKLVYENGDHYTEKCFF